MIELNDGDFVPDHQNQQFPVNPDCNLQSRNTIATALGHMDLDTNNTKGQGMGIRTGQRSLADSININANLPAEELANNSWVKMETNFNAEDIPPSCNESSILSSSQKVSSVKGDHEIPVCRICLGTEEEGTPSEENGIDKLICPCKCAGTMGLIHISCLKEWVNSKRLVYKGAKVQSFFWKALECELCQEPFENRMKYCMFSIMNFDLPNDGDDYVILESIKSAPAKVIHVFDLKNCDGQKNIDGTYSEKNEFKVGRSIDTDMKIADISVSRVHSYIRIDDSKLVLDDNGSKFGTLIKVKKPIELLSILNKQGNEFNSKFKFNSNIFQIGRTMMYFKFYD